MQSALQYLPTPGHPGLLKQLRLLQEEVHTPHQVTVHFILYTVHCTLYTVHCTLYTVHCTLYTVHCAIQLQYVAGQYCVV